MPAPATLLVVDDVPANLGLVFDALTRAGYRVLVAESGEGALAQLDHEIPDLMLLDSRLPGIDGLEVCRRVKARPETADLPVIFLTAIDVVGEKVHALEAGAVDYVTKPIEPAELLARVRTHLRLAQLQRELAEELAMRREAEEQLRDSLDRGLVVAAPDGTLRFATRLAQTLLVHHFPGAPREILPEALRAVAATGNGGTVAGLEVRVLRALASGSDSTVLELTSGETAGPSVLLALGLTPREAEVLYWLSEGKTNPEIGLIVNSSRRTVEKHVEHILDKLGVENRLAAGRLAMERLRRA